MRYAPSLATYLFRTATRYCGSTSLVLLLLLSLTGTPETGISATEQQEKEEISKGIKKYRINIGRLQEGIKKQEEQIRLKKKVELTLLTELQDIDTRLTEQNHKIDTLAERIATQHKVIAEKNDAIAASSTSMQQLEDHHPAPSQ